MTFTPFLQRMLTPSLPLVSAMGASVEGMAAFKATVGKDLRTVLIGKVDCHDYTMNVRSEHGVLASSPLIIKRCY